VTRAEKFEQLRAPVAAAFAALWFVTGSAGGIAITTALFFSDGALWKVLPSVPGLGGFGEAVVGYPALVAVLYGVPTGVVLAVGRVVGHRTGSRSG
jgi:hypothetical protein